MEAGTEENPSTITKKKKRKTIFEIPKTTNNHITHQKELSVILETKNPLGENDYMTVKERNNVHNDISESLEK